MFRQLLLMVFPALAIYAAIYDFRHYRITNRTNLIIFASFFPVALLAGMPWEMMLDHLRGFVLTFAVMFVLYMVLSANKFGGGDAKMISAVSIWVGFSHLLEFGIMTALAGGALAAVMWLWRALQIEYGVWMNGDATLRKVMSYNIKLPYGAAIAAGGVYAYLQGWWGTMLLGS